MNGPKVVIAILTALIAALLLLACGHRSARLLDKTLTARGQITRGQTPVADESGGQKLLGPPDIWKADKIGVMHAASAEEGITTIPLTGANVPEEGGYGYNSGNPLAYQNPDQSSVTLRAFSQGDWAWALFSAQPSADNKPFNALIDTDACLKIGGGRDDEIPLAYYAAIADYSAMAWRWFGPYVSLTPDPAGHYSPPNVLLQFNNDALKSRFTSPYTDLSHICVLAVDRSTAVKATSTPAEGYLGALPPGITLDTLQTSKSTSLEGDDEAGVVVKVINLDTASGLDTEPAVVLELTAAPTEAGVLLDWAPDPDPDVDVYQVFRDDPDDAAAPALIKGVLAPDTEWQDTTGIPGKEYTYGVRARNLTGYGGKSYVTATRTVAAPASVSASDGTYSNYVALTWTAVEGAQSYKVWRAESASGLKSFVRRSHDLSANPEWNDYAVTMGQLYYYYLQAVGEDAEGPLSAYETGFAVVLEPVQVIASDGAPLDKVELLWGMADTADGYHVYRALDEGDPAPLLIADITNNTTVTFDDALAPWNVPRYYFVKTVVGGFEVITGAGDWGHRGLTQVKNVTASQGLNALGVNVDWDAVNNATRYAVYRLDAPGVPTGANFIGEVTAPQTDYFDDTAAWSGTEGVHYYYYVTARFEGPDAEQSMFSAEAQGWRGIGVPQNIAASDGIYPDKVAVSWDTVTQAASYLVFRDPTGASFPATVNAPMTVYYDTDVSPGTDYTYTVIACVADGAGEQSVSDTGFANQPPVADLTADVTEGDAPLTVNYDASASYDPDGTIVNYEWDWTNDGTPDFDSGTDPTVQHIYNTAGEYTCSVNVTDDYAAVDSASATVKALHWKTVTVDSGGDVGMYTSMSVANGNPAISYYDNTNLDLKYVRATDASGATWGTPLTIDSAGDMGRYASLRVVNGNPSISYQGNGLKYVRATDANGASWGTRVTVDSNGSTGHFSSLQVVNGNPAICHFENGTRYQKYVRATDADGGIWGTPVTIDTVGGGAYSSLLVVNGNPAISYYKSYLMYTRGTDADGSAWEAPVTVDDAGDVGYCNSLLIVNGNPAIGYNDDTNDDLKYVRGTDANGANWGTPVTVDSVGSVGIFVSLKVVSGNPAMSYYDTTNGGLKYVRAADTNGDSWGTSVIIDNIGDVGWCTSLTEVDGQPAISYYDITNGDLKYAYYTTDP